jgi:hypothetical protein
MSANWHKGEMTDNNEKNDSGWKTVNKSKKTPSKGRNKGRQGGRANDRGGGRGGRGNDRGGRGNGGRKKSNLPSIPYLIKTIVQGALVGFIKETEQLPSKSELVTLIHKIFEDVRTPNRRVDRAEFQYRQGLKFSDHEGMIKATILNTIVPELMHFGVIHPEFDIGSYVADVLTPLIRMVEENSSKAANGFHPVNQLFWDKRMRDMIDDGLKIEDEQAQLYIQKQIEVIEAMKEIGVSRVGLNKNSEDWLLSYFEGIKAGRTMFDKRVVAALADDLDTKKLVREVINKITPKMPQTMVRKFKYLILMDMPGLTQGLLVNILGSYVFAKKRGVHDRVTSFLEMALNFLKVGKDEFDDESDVLCLWLKENYVCNAETIRQFLISLVDQTMIILSEKAERSKSMFAGQWAWDVIGSLIGEISVILDDPNIFREFFESQIHAVTSGSDGENQMLTLVAHTILQLSKNPAIRNNVGQKRAALGRYLTTSICHTLGRLEFGVRTRMLIEDQISEFLAPAKATRAQIKIIKLSEVGQTLHSDQMTEYLELLEGEDEQEDEVDGEVDADGDNIGAKASVTEVIECNYASDTHIALSTEARRMPDTDYPTFMGYRDMCRVMAKGTSSWCPITTADAETLYRMIGNIAYYVASELHPSPDRAEMRTEQIATLVTVLESYVDRPKIQAALQTFNEDLDQLSEATLDYLWDNTRGKENFADFCNAFGVESIFG